MESNGEYDLRPQDHPFGDKDLRFDQFKSYSFGTFRLVQIGRGYPGSSSSCTFSWLLPVTVPVKSPFLYIVVRNRKEVHRVLNEFLILLCSFSQKVPARAVDDADVQYDKHTLHCVLGSVSSNSHNSMFPTS